MARAIWVAFEKSLLAPVVTSSPPNISSSAARPPMLTSIVACISLLLLLSSLVGRKLVIPSALPLGITVTLWRGWAPGV